ncbi:hypothetical protein BOX15_Mlig000469g1 [Macrostomum lignano]|uniref:Rab-GAP TBC domain-containing protein n=2 Tax=Macrostomum lignano TaxID=282301 RepID=A0A267GJ98_9PLAT|nr:hypothetical protein BOX15_Mlig000469g1 [Macrostomum lignano]
MSLFDFQSREVVHVKVKLCSSTDDAVYKKFSIDPGITTFEVLQRLLSRAFDIKCDFTISYLVTDDIGEKVYLSMLSDWDLDAAILSASDPILRLKITLRNFDNATHGLDSGVFTFHQSYNQSFEDGLNHEDESKMACMDKDWDIISRGELPLQSQAGLLALQRQQQKEQQQQQQQQNHQVALSNSSSVVANGNSSVSQQPPQQQSSSSGGSGPSQFFSQLGSHVGKSMITQMQKAVGGWKLLPELNLPSSSSSGPALPFARQDAMSAPPRPPVSDREFQSHLDSAGRVRDFWALKQAVFLGGLDPSLRKVAWRLLLPVFPKGSTGQERIAFMKRSAQRYFEMKRCWKETYAAGQMSQAHLALITAISKDVIRTDRGHPFYSGGNGNVATGGSMADAAESEYSPHILQLFDLLVTYAIYHPSVGYAQGMSDLASPLLVVQKDEAYAYICFCALMCRTMDNFRRESTAMLTKFQHLHDLIVHMDAELAAFLRCHGLADMFFTHRWLLLEMKREFQFDDTLRMLEVQWAGLPHLFTFPKSADGVPLQEDACIGVASPASASTSAAAAVSPPSPKDTPYLRLQSMLRQSREEASAAASSGASATAAVVLKDGVVELPPPEVLGCGNPFLLFMCASMLQEHRDRVMRSCHDMCEIVMHFNRLIRSHNLGAILNRARQMYTEYMEAQDDKFSLALTSGAQLAGSSN